MEVERTAEAKNTAFVSDKGTGEAMTNRTTSDKRITWKWLAWNVG